LTEFSIIVNKDKMASFGVCSDTSEAVPLFDPQGLYLIPIAKINISVQLPALKSPGNSISNWEVMEKLKKMIKPDSFLLLKVSKSTLEFVRFEGEVENKSKMKVHIGNLDGKTIKLSGFPDELKVRAAETKIPFPSRHDWDSFFRDAQNMNEMKPGERPDTIHIRDLPSRWFANKKDKNRDIPSEFIVRKVFETFGEIQCIDIPMLDPYRREMVSAKGAIQMFSFGQDFLFEVYIQYSEYMGFVKAMTALRGMKLMYKDDGDKVLTAMIRVDFDKTKHLSEKAIRRRVLERERMIQLEKEREDRVRREREEEDRKREEEKRRIEAEELDRERKRDEKVKRRSERRTEREEKRRQAKLERKRLEEETEMQRRIAVEERKILIAQRKLETIRLLSELFSRIKVMKQQEEVERREKELEQERLLQIELERQRQLEEERRKIEEEKRKREELQRQELELRAKILRNIKLMEEKRSEQQREDLRKKLAGTTKLKSAVVMKK